MLYGCDTILIQGTFSALAVVMMYRILPVAVCCLFRSAAVLYSYHEWSIVSYDKEGSDLIDQEAARIVQEADGSSRIAERRLQGAPLADNLCDHSGRDFAPSK